MKRTNFFSLLLMLALVLSGASLLSSCALAYRLGSFESNGERIYFTAESSSGRRISSSGGANMMMRQRTACVSCHGPDGKGGRVTMMMWRFRAPDITWYTLAQEEHHGEKPEEGGHEEHPPYTEETLKRAITSGIDPAGEPLDDLMPRWRMSESDLEDLVQFIKTLE